MCGLLSNLHQLRSIYIYKKGEVVQQNTFSLPEVKCVDCNLIYIYIYKKGEEVQQNTFSHSEVKCVDCNLIYINSDLFISTKKEKWCNKIFGSLQI